MNESKLIEYHGLKSDLIKIVDIARPWTCVIRRLQWWAVESPDSVLIVVIMNAHEVCDGLPLRTLEVEVAIVIIHPFLALRSCHNQAQKKCKQVWHYFLFLSSLYYCTGSLDWLLHTQANIYFYHWTIVFQAYKNDKIWYCMLNLKHIWQNKQTIKHSQACFSHIPSPQVIFLDPLLQSWEHHGM